MSVFLAAGVIYDGLGQKLRNHVIQISNEGIILRLFSQDELDRFDIGQEVKYISGAIAPGMVNAHCHLELSHLKGKIDTGTGLLKFLDRVVGLRNETSMNEVLNCIEKQDKNMWEAGIQAVGDISNAPHTAGIKRNSRLRYHTFIEVFDFCQDHLAEQFWNSALETRAAMPSPTSLVPHSPYTVSKSLMKLIDTVEGASRLSIHNQEMSEENILHRGGCKELSEFLQIFGFSYPAYIGGMEGSLDYTIANIRGGHPTLLVHNTQTTRDDIRKAQAHFDNVFWVSCPNANLYIENRLPDYDAFLDNDAIICLGTDSLSSNWQLSVLEEVKTLRKFRSGLASATLISWACGNGARALGFDEIIGNIAEGMQPGLIQLFPLDEHGEIFSDTTVKRLV